MVCHFYIFRSCFVRYLSSSFHCWRYLPRINTHFHSICHVHEVSSVRDINISKSGTLLTIFLTLYLNVSIYRMVLSVRPYSSISDWNINWLSRHNAVSPIMLYSVSSWHTVICWYGFELQRHYDLSNESIGEGDRVMLRCSQIYWN